MSFHVGDTTPPLTGTLTTAGQPVNLTGAGIVAHVRKPDRTVITLPAVAGSGGAVTAEWVDPLDQAGSWRAEFQVTYSDGKVQTFGPASFHVAEQIG